MQRDATHRSDAGVPPDVSEADVIEQSMPVRPDADESTAGDQYDEPVPPDANPADVMEQRLDVPLDEDDYPSA